MNIQIKAAFSKPFWINLMKFENENNWSTYESLIQDIGLLSPRAISMLNAFFISLQLNKLLSGKNWIL